MNKPSLSSFALILTLTLSGCAQKPFTTGSTVATPETGPKRGTPAVPGRPARMYVLAGFRELDCSPLTPEVKVTTPPAKGKVSLRPNQMTTIQFSRSGQCVGQKVAGTGIYYTARNGEAGADSFTIVATAGRNAPWTKTFRVKISE